MKDVKGNCNSIFCCIYVNTIWEFLPDYLCSKVRGHIIIIHKVEHILFRYFPENQRL